MMFLRNFFGSIALGSLLAICAACDSSSDGDIRYVAIGASDATGIGASPIDNGYVYRIDDGIDSQCSEGSQLINLGIPSVEADEVDDVELPLAVEIDPDLVTVFVGGNDIIHGRTVESFESDVAKILVTLRNDTEAAIFIANLPDLTQLPRFRNEPDPDVTTERIVAYNAAIARQAAMVGVTVIDLYSEEVDDSLVSDDGFHPNDAGHDKIANLFLQEIIPQVCSAN